MKLSRLIRTPIVAIFISLSLSLTAFSQTEKLGGVSFTPPKGWTKTLKENIVSYSDLNEATGKYCIITLYGATPGTGSAKDDFIREWTNLVTKPFGADANPKTETETIDG